MLTIFFYNNAQPGLCLSQKWKGMDEFNYKYKKWCEAV